MCSGFNWTEQRLTQHRLPGKSSGQLSQTLISRFGDTTCPARSLGRAVPGYFLWGYVKSKAYETFPANIDDLKQRILECIQGISQEMLQLVMTNFPWRLQECIERHGGHLRSAILKH